MKMRRGFTLVELLIVIVIIGILAAAMMLSSGSATAAARAATIISDLRSLKAAALMHYIDSLDEFTSNDKVDPVLSMVKTYMDNPKKVDQGYGIFATGNSTNGCKWWVYCSNVVDAAVQQKLAARAGSIGLYSTANTNNNYESGQYVYMIAK